MEKLLAVLALVTAMRLLVWRFAGARGLLEWKQRVVVRESQLLVV